MHAHTCVRMFEELEVLIHKNTKIRVHVDMCARARLCGRNKCNKFVIRGVGEDIRVEREIGVE